MHRDAVERDRRAVEKDSRRRGIDLHLSEAEAREQVIDWFVVCDEGGLEHVERGQAWAPQVCRANGKRRGHAKHRGPADLADVGVMVEQRFRIGWDQARSVGVEPVARVDLGWP